MRTILAFLAPVVLLASTFATASPVRHATRDSGSCSPPLSGPIWSQITYDKNSTMGWVPQLSKVETLQRVVVETLSSTSPPELVNWNITAAPEGTYRVAFEGGYCLSAYGGQVSQTDCDSPCGTARYMLDCQSCTSTGGSGCLFRSIYAGLCATATGEGGTLAARECDSSGMEESDQYFSFAKLSPNRASEVYEEGDSLTLNLALPPQRWFNMGYWKQGGTESFPDAAAELCRRVAVAAKLQPGERLCEVGYGSGDSTLLVAQEFSPSSYVGFTSLPSQHAVAARRVADAQLDPKRFRVRHGDAAKDLRTLPTGSADVVIAVDCAYHFNPRSAFLSSAHRLLAPAGRLALTDLVLPSKPLSLVDTLLLSLVCLAAGLPRGNLRTAAAYRAELVSLGYDRDAIEMTDISDAVWPGFLAFVERRDEQLGRPGVLGKSWSGLRLYARVVRWYSGVGGAKARLRFYLISAAKAGGSASKVY
ncbi:hypothetical protein JCM5296_006244 [Sporobolomyces johnsonii]